MIVDLNHSDFEKEIINSEKPAIVKFYSLWNSASRNFSEMFSEMSLEYEGKIKFAESNIDGDPSIAQNLGISKIPSIAIFFAGKELKQMLNPSKALLRVELDSALRKSRKI
ncbi:MAG: thioredoxin domain-containing protein [Candidatus Woesearchaeota archaeon]|nr:thioredoxin domain-containing protein [Candidatus Woesearchaeota archaeon]